MFVQSLVPTPAEWERSGENILARFPFHTQEWLGQTKKAWRGPKAAAAAAGQPDLPNPASFSIGPVS